MKFYIYHVCSSSPEPVLVEDSDVTGCAKDTCQVLQADSMILLCLWPYAT